ncbi:MAG: polyketide cyclase [Chloracidobacterium sp. CP2_5A]|nr:MAG: polyketide cyclase [Chloracidobacterium sp. CP2_5A]
MPEFTAVIDIAAPPARVWQVWTDLARWPEWMPTAERVERLDIAPLGVGSRIKIQRAGAQRAEWRIICRRFTTSSKSNGLAVTADHVVTTQAGGARAQVTPRVEGWLGWLLGRFLKDFTEAMLAGEAAGLRAQSERLETIGEG